MKTIRLLLTLCLVAALTVSPVLAETQPGQEAELLDYLSREQQANADHLIRTGEDVDDIYTELNWDSQADTFPARFDLRERGTVTSVKDQTPWSTCWSFAAIAASETSILNAVGMTTDEYRETFGRDLDLSERHLAWFTATALPEPDQYPEGEYPYYSAQAGEGLYPMEGEEKNLMDFGGNSMLALTTLANGTGILLEEYAPYVNNGGTKDAEGDWSLPEDMRYSVSYELKDANILPAPAAEDPQGNYVYRPAATEAIKSELLAGRAVAVSIRADMFAPGQEPMPTPEEKRAQMLGYLKDLTGATDAEKERFADLWSRVVPMASATDGELKALI